MKRDFAADFLIPMMESFPSREDQKRIALALDCAIAFGALEVHEGQNASLADSELLAQLYAEKVKRLHAL